MHVTIFNGSPRAQKFSNTDKIIKAFGNGLKAEGATYELITLSNKANWDNARDSFMSSDNIIIALPLYVECIPGLLIEFLESLPRERKEPTQLSFILQSGFAEGHQLRCGEEFLASLPAQLGCTYGGCLVKGDNFGIRVFEGSAQERMLKPYVAMGSLFARYGSFKSEEARKFTGPEKFSLPLRLMIGVMFKFKGPKLYASIASKWGCVKPINDRPY